MGRVPALLPSRCDVLRPSRRSRRVRERGRGRRGRVPVVGQTETGAEDRPLAIVGWTHQVRAIDVAWPVLRLLPLYSQRKCEGIRHTHGTQECLRDSTHRFPSFEYAEKTSYDCRSVVPRDRSVASRPTPGIAASCPPRSAHARQLADSVAVSPGAGPLPANPATEVAVLGPDPRPFREKLEARSRCENEQIVRQLRPAGAVLSGSVSAIACAAQAVPAADTH